MPIPTPGAPIFHPTVALPAGADPPTRSSIATPLEQLADRTAALGEFVDFTLGEFRYPGLKVRTKFFGVSRAILGFKETDGAPEWKMLDQGIGAPLLLAVPVAGAQRARMWIPLDLPEGAVIKAYTAYLEKGANNAVAADQWGARLSARGGFLLFPGSASVGLTGLGAGIQRAGSGTGRATVGESGLSHPVQGMADYYAYIEGPATEHANDRVWGVAITFEDPGPRP
jgi:hypothetical protein